MDITLKGNNGEKVVIPIEDLIQKYWSDENGKPNRIEMSAKVKDETILAAMTICDEKEENYLSVDLESRNEKFDTEALWCSLEAPNTLNPFVTGSSIATLTMQCASTIPQMTRFLPSSNTETKRSSRKTRTRIHRWCRCSATIWQVKSVKI